MQNKSKETTKKKKKKKKSRREYFKNIDTQELEAQFIDPALRKPSNDDITLEVIVHQLEERVRVAGILCYPPKAFKLQHWFTRAVFASLSMSFHTTLRTAWGLPSGTYLYHPCSIRGFGGCPTLLACS